MKRLNARELGNIDTVRFIESPLDTRTPKEKIRDLLLQKFPTPFDDLVRQMHDDMLDASGVSAAILGATKDAMTFGTGTMKVDWRK